MGSAKLVYNAELEYDATHEARIAHPFFFFPYCHPVSLPYPGLGPCWLSTAYFISFER